MVIQPNLILLWQIAPQICGMSATLASLPRVPTFVGLVVGDGKSKAVSANGAAR
jgi:hypothetical protein